MYRKRKLDFKKPLDMLRFIFLNPFVWPGGYEVCALATDGGLICSKCVKENYRLMFSATKYKFSADWEISGIVIDNELEEVFCDHCSKELGYHDN